MTLTLLPQIDHHNSPLRSPVVTPSHIYSSWVLENFLLMLFFNVTSAFLKDCYGIALTSAVHILALLWGSQGSTSSHSAVSVQQVVDLL